MMMILPRKASKAVALPQGAKGLRGTAHSLGIQRSLRLDGWAMMAVMGAKQGSSAVWAAVQLPC